MALDGLFAFPRPPAEPRENDDAQLESGLGERIFTAVVISAAVLVVAVIAVLMGTVGP